MNPRYVHRLEGLIVFTLAVLALAPDRPMLGYLAGPRSVAPPTISRTRPRPHSRWGTAGAVAGVTLPVLVALVSAGHIGADRLVGCGLKYPTGFAHTHLSPGSLPAPNPDPESGLEPETEGVRAD